MPKDRLLEKCGARPAPSSNRGERGGPETGRDKPQVTQQARGRAEAMRA